MKEMPLRHVLERPFEYDDGNAFIAALPTSFVEKAASGDYVLALLEDGRDLGPADTLHETIRKNGSGAFSIWRDHIWFSSAANEDCENNGRQYELWLFEAAKGSALYNHVVSKITTDDAAFLQVAKASAFRNNSMLSTFFGARETIGDCLKKFDVGVPDAVLELGCGQIPWIGLRFLLDGTQRYVANDIMHVRRTFPADEMKHLRSFCAMVQPDLLPRWPEVLGDGTRDAAPIGLEVHDGAGFETLDLAGGFDLAISTSVLEHVMDPDRVYEKLAEATQPGGFMCHSIDLRDHRSFESDPLAFLRESEEQYASVKTENRLRASDHRAFMHQAGFDILYEKSYILEKSGAARWTEHPLDAEPYVTPHAREAMDVRFGKYDCLDLSTIAILVVCRKRQAT